MKRACEICRFSSCWQPNAAISAEADDGSFWPVLEGIPAAEVFKSYSTQPGHACRMFMERFGSYRVTHMRMSLSTEQSLEGQQ